MFFRFLFLFPLLAFLSFSFPLFGYAALSGNLVSWEGWRSRGDVEIREEEGMIIFDSESGGSHSVFQDIPVSGYAGKYLVIAAFSWIEEDAGYRSPAASQIYGSLYNAQGIHIGMISPQSLRHRLVKGGEWDVLYATVAIPASAQTLRLFLEREGGYLEDRFGRRAAMYDIAVRGVNSLAEGRAYIHDAYWDRLSLGDPRGEEGYIKGHEVLCSEGRQDTRISAGVSSEVYAGRQEGLWTLWVANEDAWLWDRWGKQQEFFQSSRARGVGSLCMKSGDRIRINGVFSSDSYLVFSSEGSPADVITDIRIAGERYEIGAQEVCTWDSNGMGGYDILCEVP